MYVHEHCTWSYDNMTSVCVHVQAYIVYLISPGGDGDLSQSISELKNIVLNFSREIRSQLATINDTVTTLQGQCQPPSMEVDSPVANTRLLARIIDQLDQLRTELTGNQHTISERVDGVGSQQVEIQNTLDTQLANVTDQLSTGLNQLRTELTANQQMISERVDGVSSQQVRIQNETMVQLQIVHTTLDTQLANATDKLCTKLNQLKKELTTNQPSSDLECNRTQMKNVSAQEQNSTEAPQDTQNAPVYQHPCGASPGWRRVAFLNMTDPSQDCPSGWSLTSHSVRTCGRASYEQSTCDSVTFPVSGGEYSRVCGRIMAYQYGSAWAFRGAIGGQSLDGSYVDGISITHGLPRQHIWSFAVGLAQEIAGIYALFQYCYCDVQTHPGGSQAIPPSFVGNDYFCEAGESGLHFVHRLYLENPLWDGQNCGQNSTCCSMNNPPYFMKDLPAPTTDDIEVRICSESNSHASDYPIELLEIYVQ